MEDGPTWAIREAGEADAAALALIGAATFLETFAGILDGEAIVGHCAAQHQEAAYRAYLASGARAWLAEAQPEQVRLIEMLAITPRRMTCRC